MLVSPRTAQPIAVKYAVVPLAVAKLEPSEIGTIFKHTKSPFSFFPSIGLFAVEFALGYCNNMHYKPAASSGSAVRTSKK